MTSAFRFLTATVITLGLLVSGCSTATAPRPMPHADYSLSVADIPFQDPAFKACVQAQGIEDPLKITELDCSLNPIQSAAELHYFPALEKLDLSLTQIRTLDLRNNTRLKSLKLFPLSGLSELNLSRYPKLQELALDGENSALATQALAVMPNLQTLTLGFNKLQQLTLNQPQLHKLSLIDSRSLQQLTLNTPQLQDLYSDRSQLNTLDLSTSDQLVNLDIRKAPLQQLTLGQQPQLTRLNLEQGQLSQLDLSGAPALEQLVVSRQQLTGIDLSHNPRIRELDLDNNQLTALNLNAQRDLSRLFVKNNPLPRLKTVLGESSLFYNCIDSKRLDYTVEVFSMNCLAGPDIRRLNFKSLSNLRELKLRLARGINTLDLRPLTGLETLSVTSRRKALQQIRLPQSPYLSAVDLSDNQLQAIRIPTLPALQTLNLAGNQLTGFQLSAQPALKTLSLTRNPLQRVQIAPQPVLQTLEVSREQRATLTLPILGSTAAEPTDKPTADNQQINASR